MIVRVAGQRVEAERRHGRTEAVGRYVQRDHARDGGRQGAEAAQCRGADIDPVRHGPATGTAPVAEARAQAGGGTGLGVGTGAGGGRFAGRPGRVERRGTGGAGEPGPGGRLRRTGHTRRERPPPAAGRRSRKHTVPQDAQPEEAQQADALQEERLGVRPNVYGT